MKNTKQHNKRKMRISSLPVSCVFIGMLSLSSVHAYCFADAAKTYRINENLLRAIAWTESSMRANIESPTDDIGLMGINRSWLPVLKRKYGISEAAVWDPCTNVKLGAWILADNFFRKGFSWNAVGAYAASCTKKSPVVCASLRQQYAQRVWKQYQKITNK